MNRSFERWQRIEPLIRGDLTAAGIDMIPRNLAEIFAKIHTGEIIGGKGVFLFGNTGTGKSRRLKWAAESFDIAFISAGNLCRELMQAETPVEIDDILHCTPPRWSEVPEHYNDLIIDDLGTEPDTQNVYGTKVDLISETITRRYEVFPRWKTHFTSNLTKDEIRARYGERIWSRLNEMCVFITLIGKDRRIG